MHIINGESGLVNAPTGCGKTFSVFLGSLIQFINEHPGDWKTKKNNGLQMLWLTPLRALAKDIGRAMEQVFSELNMQWTVGIRNGDTALTERARQKKQMPEVLIITPESLQLLLAMKQNEDFFKRLRIIAVDEWHELLGSKRGVQVELAVSHILHLKTPEQAISVWGISATIGNMEEARQVLLSALQKKGVLVKAELNKKIQIESIFPDEIERFPWAGHLGTRLAHKLQPIIEESRTTLIFINTRGMSETWYQTLLTVQPELAGNMALHHGSVEQEIRTWIEDSLHEGALKVVIATASLDLGVDFRPVDTVVQVGSPKGVARFLQRAGRSGHQPDAISKIYFLPTHSLELMEAAALKEAVFNQEIESRDPMLLCYDVLIQFLCTLAVGNGFKPEEIYEEVKTTYCYAEITDDDWQQILHFIVNGGNALQQYDEYQKVIIDENDGLYKITNRRTAMRHRMHIGTIVSEPMMKIKFMGGSFVGVLEENFIARLQPGDVFMLAGRKLELVNVKDMVATVKKSNAGKAIVPSWAGGRMPLSSNLSALLRRKLNEVSEWLDSEENKNLIHEKVDLGAVRIAKRTMAEKSNLPKELTILKPLFDLQRQLSHIPLEIELLIEHIETGDGYHLFVYPFEGRLVHEAMSALMAYRISAKYPITFSIAMNDYGFELLSDQPIPVDDSNAFEWFSPDNLVLDIQKSNNATEMAKRKFRDVAVIGGLVFQGMPGERKKARHLQASSSLLFKVFSEYDPDNLLLRQAYNEVLQQQMEEVRLRNALQRIQNSNIIIKFPTRLTPFCFPIKVDSLRETLTSEKMEDRIKKMLAAN